MVSSKNNNKSCRKKRTQNCEEKHKIPGVASGQQKQETSRRLRSRQKLEVQLRKNAKSLIVTSNESSRQRTLAWKVVKIPINFSLIPRDQICKETFRLSEKMLACARESVPETVRLLLDGKLMDKFGPSYRTFVSCLLKNIYFKVHLRCLQQDAGLLSDEAMAGMHPLHLLKLLDGVNNTFVASEERSMKVLVSEFSLGSSDIITELVEKIVKAFAEVAPDEAMSVFAKVAHERQTMLARKLIKSPIKFYLVPPDQKTEAKRLFNKMYVSARENVPKAVLRLLESKFMDKFGRSYRRFVRHLLENIWLRVHVRCLQEDAVGLGLSHHGMAEIEMQPLQLLKLLDGVNNTHPPSGERKMKVLVSEFFLDTPDIMTELVEKMVKAFAEVAPDDAKEVFAKVAHQDAMDQAMAIAVQGISLAK